MILITGISFININFPHFFPGMSVEGAEIQPIQMWVTG